jgi:DNA polymerase
MQPRIEHTCRIGADSFLPPLPPLTLSALQNEIAICTACPSMKPWRQFEPSASGNPHTGYLMVGEAPGYVSWKQHRRFTGPAGMLVRRALRQVGHPRYQDLEDLFYMTDVIKCHPASATNSAANRSPKAVEVHACSHYLLKELGVLAPSLVVAFGKLASDHVREALAALEPSRPEVIAFPHPSPRNQLTILKHYLSLPAFQESLTETFRDLIVRLEEGRSHA